MQFNDDEDNIMNYQYRPALDDLDDEDDNNQAEDNNDDDEAPVERKHIGIPSRSKFANAAAVQRKPVKQQAARKVEEDDEAEDDANFERELTFEERLRLNEAKKKAAEAAKQASARTLIKSEEPNKQPFKRNEEAPKEVEVKKKKNKSAPKEVSSKIKVSQFRDVTSSIAPKKQRARDPRFDPMYGGKPSEEDFGRFLNNFSHATEMAEQEIQKYRKYLQDNKDKLKPHQFSSIQRRIAKLNSILQKKKVHKWKQEILSEHTQQEAEKIAQTGKKPYFLKQSEIKQKLQEKRLEELKNKGHGKLKKYMQKKRSRTKEFDARMMPAKRTRF